MMLKVGLSGGIGSGKSLVAKIFAELGVPVYHADEAARSLMESDSDVVSKITELFGGKAYSDGRLNRKYIAGIVFHDDEKLGRLNAIVHPAVQMDFESWIHAKSDVKYVLKEAAILFETGSYRLLDSVVLVKANRELRIRRVMERDAISREDVIARMKNQMDDKEKEKLADFVINNEEDSMILPQIVDLHHHFMNIMNK